MSTQFVHNCCRMCQTKMKEGHIRCPSCGSWNNVPTTRVESSLVRLSEFLSTKHTRIETGPWDPCFANPPGLVCTGLTLLGGARGAGKSTLALQIANALARATRGDVFYLGSEEAGEEISLRASRLELDCLGQLLVTRTMSTLSDFSFLDSILTSKTPPRGFVLDSFFSVVGDNREAAATLLAKLKKLSVTLRAPGIIIDQITKEGSFAGPEFLAHGVDTMLALQLDDSDGTRYLRTLKNRFGPAHVEREFVMTETGLILKKCLRCSKLGVHEENCKNAK